MEFCPDAHCDVCDVTNFALCTRRLQSSKFGNFEAARYNYGLKRETKTLFELEIIILSKMGSTNSPPPEMHSVLFWTPTIYNFAFL
jgi:hypothetical protein